MRDTCPSCGSSDLGDVKMAGVMAAALAKAIVFDSNSFKLAAGEALRWGRLAQEAVSPDSARPEVYIHECRTPGCKKYVFRCCHCDKMATFGRKLPIQFSTKDCPLCHKDFWVIWY